MTKTKKLTHRQKLFVDWYIKIGNATQAAIRAGYSQKTAFTIASENLRKPYIRDYYKHRMTELEELLGFNKATIVQDLLNIKDKSMQAVPVMEYDRSSREMVQQTAMVEDEKGEKKEVGVFEYDSFGANKAIDTIAKMMGYFEPEKHEDVTPAERKVPTTVVINKTYVFKDH